MTPAQITALQADIAALVTAVQAAAAGDAAVAAAGAQLVADAQADFPPTPVPVTAKATYEAFGDGHILAAFEAFLASPAGQALLKILIGLLPASKE